MRARLYLAFGGGVLACLLLDSRTALAWDTATDPDGWRSVYIRTPFASALPALGFQGNEHSELAHITLQQMGLADCLGLATDDTGSCSLSVVDLNAALNHTQVTDASHEGDDPDTLLEERWVPPPAHFAGLPDYSWAVYDWINKNTLCPPVPPGSVAFSRCHDFTGWMGLFNANHFGTQATLMYAYYHDVALRHAASASQLRAQLGATAARAYIDYLLEAELLALIFESVAQHFLQDRWSSGHMFERWNGADLATAESVAESALAGAASGLVHGSEGITKLPDPMCSPVVDRGFIGARAIPVEWSAAGQRYPGVGDYRLRDMYDGFFGVEYGEGDMPFSVQVQEQRMHTCSRAGWAEVISALGVVDGGRYGMLDLTLPEEQHPPLVSNAACFEHWATNTAIHSAWANDAVVTAANTLSRATFASPLFEAMTGSANAALSRTSWVEVTWRVRMAKWLDPNGTTLARGGIGKIGQAMPGNAYAYDATGQPYIASYVDPKSLASLPLRDSQSGRDRLTMYGFFNRAHVDYWCADIEATLTELRGSDDPLMREACSYLADRVYKATDPDYKGPQSEMRRYSGENLEPICSTFGVRADAVSDSLPYYLHQGYVHTPDEMGLFGFASVEAWCRRVPVLDPNSTPPGAHVCSASMVGEDVDDVVAVLTTEGGDATLVGRDLGTSGEVWARTSETGDFVVRIPTRAWSEAQIELDVPRGWLSEGDWFIQIRPRVNAGEERSSVGRFILRVLGGLPAAPVVTEVEILAPLVPGEDAPYKVTVIDPESASDLTQGDESVTVTSDALTGVSSPIPGPGTGAGACGATFSATDEVKKPKNDRSNCDPSTWELRARATDSAVFPPPTGPAVTGPTFVKDITIENVPPFVDDSVAPELVMAPPGGQVRIVVKIADDNNDHPTECEELLASDVHITSVLPSGLRTTPPIDASLGFNKLDTDTSTGTSTFDATVTVLSPHADNDATVGQGCEASGAAPYEVSYDAKDDAGLPLTAEPLPIPVRVGNVAPIVLQVQPSPGALHPGVPTEVTFTVTVDDANFPEDVKQVRLDVAGCGGGEAFILLAALEPARSGVWRGTASLVATAQDGCVVSAQAEDNNCQTSEDFTLQLPVMNVAPQWTGLIAGHDGESIIECTTIIRHVVGFSDLNGDTLSVVVVIDGSDFHAELPLPRDATSGHYIADYPAPCAGTYTVTYKATETNIPGGGAPKTASAPPYTLTVLAGPPEDCPLCHPELFCDPAQEQCCLTDNDCNDADVCTTQSCVEHHCVATPVDGSMACDDGNACTESDACQAGHCVGGALLPGCCVGATAAPGAACTPSCTPITAEFSAPVTYYAVDCTDLGGDLLTYSWWTPSCGTLTVPPPPEQQFASWSHPHPPCDPTTEHADEPVSVHISDGTYQLTCRYPGAAPGIGPTCDKPVAVPPL